SPDDLLLFAGIPAVAPVAGRIPADEFAPARPERFSLIYPGAGSPSLCAGSLGGKRALSGTSRTHRAGGGNRGPERIACGNVLSSRLDLLPSETNGLLRCCISSWPAEQGERDRLSFRH